MVKISTNGESTRVCWLPSRLVPALIFFFTISSQSYFWSSITISPPTVSLTISLKSCSLFPSQFPSQYRSQTWKPSPPWAEDNPLWGRYLTTSESRVVKSTLTSSPKQQNSRKLLEVFGTKCQAYKSVKTTISASIWTLCALKTCYHKILLTMICACEDFMQISKSCTHFLERK